MFDDTEYSEYWWVSRRNQIAKTCSACDRVIAGREQSFLLFGEMLQQPGAVQGARVCVDCFARVHFDAADDRSFTWRIRLQPKDGC